VFLLYDSLAPSTRRTHQSIIKNYEPFCGKHSYPPFSSSILAASHWLSILLATIKATTAKSYLSALRSFHIRTGQSTAAFDDERLNVIIRGGKCVYGEGSKAVRYPITSEFSFEWFETVNNEEGINAKAALCVGFAAILRSGEFTWDTWFPDSHHTCLSRKHVVFKSDGSVILTLPTSKTDPFHIGVDIYLAQSPRSPLCPVAALHHLFHRYPVPPPCPLVH
jgi:hypothetical protein